jgi:TRAP-type C4-dicarboxylate transport system substrate-binding protein
MRQKNFFRWGTLMFIGLIAVLSLSILLPNLAQAQIKLRYANFPPAPTWPSIQMDRWKAEVQKRTNGKVTVETYPGSTLLHPKNMFEGVISGVADIGCSCPSYQPGLFPLSEAMDLPLGFANAKVATLVYNDLIEKYNPKEYERLKIISLFTCPPTHFITKTPVRSLKDLKGMEIRVAGTSTDIVKNLGGIPVALPASETPEALQKGVVKGLISSLETLKMMNFAAYCSYVTMADLPVVTFLVAMNKDKWNSLPSDVKKVIDELKSEHSLWTATFADSQTVESLDWSKTKYDLKVIEFPKNEKEEIPKLLKPMIDDYVKKMNNLGLPGNQILADIYKSKEKYEKQYK